MTADDAHSAAPGQAYGSPAFDNSDNNSDDNTKKC